MTQSGPLLALLSAVLFGISPVLIKATIGDLTPILTAGLLYLGSGLGLLAMIWMQRGRSRSALRELSARQTAKLAGAIITGGILAPICLAAGIKQASAFEASTLLNFETVATTLIAALIFHEQVGARVWAGKALILGGALLISFKSGSTLSISGPSLLLLVASTLWGIDNNLTRDIEELPPAILAGVKGLVAGLFNIGLAMILGESAPGYGQGGAILLIGIFCYGASLVFFVRALRAIGASRTSTYFASGPFIGMLAAVILLADRPPAEHWAAAALMLAGIWALYRETHAHEHLHAPTSHSHAHEHDEHHQHTHDGSEGPTPHDHPHVHAPLAHSHEHLPDIHHRHSH